MVVKCAVLGVVARRKASAVRIALSMSFSSQASAALHAGSDSLTASEAMDRSYRLSSPNQSHQAASVMPAIRLLWSVTSATLIAVCPA